MPYYVYMSMPYHFAILTFLLSFLPYLIGTTSFYTILLLLLSWSLPEGDLFVTYLETHRLLSSICTLSPEWEHDSSFCFTGNNSSYFIHCIHSLHSFIHSLTTGRTKTDLSCLYVSIHSPDLTCFNTSLLWSRFHCHCHWSSYPS